MCLPSSGNFVFEWSNVVAKLDFFHVDVVWQDSHPCLNSPLCGSVTVGAVCERETRVARLPIGARGVATLAWDHAVRAGERIAGLRVVEVLAVDARRLPIDGRMAPRAIGSEAALVLVFMAGDAHWRQAEPGPIQILARTERARLRGNVLRSMAGATTYAHVLAIEHVTGLRVVESLRCRIPWIIWNPRRCDRSGIYAGRTGGADGEGRMKPLVLLHLIGYLPMALKAPK